MACWDCSIDHHDDCEFIQADPAGPDDDGCYSVICCCGGWGETHLTADAEYAEQADQLKPLQWPDDRPEG